MVVDAWNARLRKCAAPQRWNAFPNAFLSSSRARAAQKCVRERIRPLRRRTFAQRALRANLSLIHISEPTRR
eukprot:11166693-Lingulodinium_polyedra.AAC.1